MSFFNNFNWLAKTYQGTDEKPDKQYSILPTVLRLAGDTRRRTVLDIACGSGFFTYPIAQRGALYVTGVDVSEVQLEIARRKALPNTEFRLADAFRDELPMTDVAVVPFVANYAENVRELQGFLVRIHNHLNHGGHAVFVVDLPDVYGHFGFKQRRRWGAVKWWCGDSSKEGCLIQNHLYNARGKCVCSLWAHYYSPLAIQFALQDAGFRNIQWHRPDVSAEGIQKYGEKFWTGYVNHPELGYITAEK